MSEKRPVLDPEDLNYVVQRYQQRIAEYGATLPSLNSGSMEKQLVRYAVHSSAIRGDRPRILDIGCGLGHFYQYLNEQNIDCEYTGYDIIPDYIAACSRKYPEAHFHLRNFFQDGIEGVYDVIVMSQVLNNRYSRSNNAEVIQTALAEAFTHSRGAVSVDMMSSYVDFQNPDVFYYSPEQIFHFAKTLSRRVSLRHDYRPFEFCIQLFHDEYDGFVP